MAPVFPSRHCSDRESNSASRATFAKGNTGFTLIEILLVVAIIITVLALITPAFNARTQSANVEAAAYKIAGSLETARSYAMANNTYTWVGFYEEDGSADSTPPAKAGVRRLVLSIVASKDGTLPYNPENLSNMDAENLIQIGKLIKIEGVHMAAFENGAGGSDDFAGRPPVDDDAARIGDDIPADSGTPFHYPVGESIAQYTFKKAVEFSPRGEARVNNSSNSLKRVAEIGLLPARGDAPLQNDPNKAAIQFTGIAGNVTIYRP
jgi:type II secretory pathway pseudopilin PulG